MGLKGERSDIAGGRRQRAQRPGRRRFVIAVDMDDVSRVVGVVTHLDPL